MADKFQLKAIITGVDKLSPKLKGIQASVAGFRKRLERTGLGKIGFDDALKGGAFAVPFVAATKAAMGLESSMADVRKVVNFDTPQQFKQMKDDIVAMSTRLPMAAKDIAAIVAAGGQAGIDRGELGKFAESAVKMGVAFDQTAEQSGEMMAKWRTAFRLTQDGVVALTDQINYLGNNGPANAQQISSIVTAIGPLGEIAGLASGQIAAMGATLAGVGVKEDVAATGMKNFMLTLTAGAAATKQQQQMFKALRLDSAAVANGMQQDAQGTLTKVLTAISKVDKSKQAAVLSTLFGRESIGAIAPMLTNLDLLRENFRRAGDATLYAGSMEKEYAERSKTTENALKLARQQVVALGIAVGDVLLPPFNDFLQRVGPIVNAVAKLASENPGLIKGVVGAAIGFTGLRLAVMGSIAVLNVVGRVLAMRATLATGVVALRGAFLASAAAMRVFGAVAIGSVRLALRGIVTTAVTAGFAALRVAVMASTVAMRVFNVVTAMSPVAKVVSVIALAAGFLIANWSTVGPWFKAMWDKAGELFNGAVEIMKRVAGFTPLGMIIKNWEPIVAWFKGLWERVKPIIEPILAAGRWVGNKVGGMLGGDSPAAAPGGLVQQAAAANRTNLQGAMVVRFENAPPGLRAEPAQTNQPGLSVTPQVGYRSLAMGGAR